MSRSQDILGLLRGIQLVAGASVKTQEAYLKHLWSHSSVRDLIEKNSPQNCESGKNVFSNPGQELQRMGKILQETISRSSVVVEGIRQYSASGKSSMNVVKSVETSNEVKDFASTYKNLDIASITLKELENLLAEHSKHREVNVKPKEVKKEEPVKVKPVQVKSTPPPPPKPRVEAPPSIAQDEAQVESVMKFITNYDRTENSSSTTIKSTAPEVSLKIRD
jgi:aarF domain-containing kinase